MSFSSMFMRWFGKRQGTIQTRKKNPRRKSFKPMLQILEDRLAPATLIVNTIQDDATTVLTGQLTLRHAIQLVNDDGNYQSILGNIATSMPAGWASQITGTFGSNDTIEFQPGLSGTIALTSGLPGITSNLTIEGPQATA